MNRTNVDVGFAFIPVLYLLWVLIDPNVHFDQNIFALFVGAAVVLCLAEGIGTYLATRK